MVRWQRSAVGVVLIAMTVSACGREVSEEQMEVASVAEEATTLRSELLVDADWLASRLEDPGVVVLHVAANPAEYQEGHVPGARFLPLSTVVEERDGIPNVLPSAEDLARSFAAAGVDEGSHVVVYGPPLMAARAFVALEHIGHPRVSLLNGGLGAWRAGGHDLSDSAGEHAPGSVRPRQTNVVVDAEWVRQRMDDPAVALIDARPPAQFTGEDPGDRVPRPGHIPGAGNLFWEELTLSSEDPRLKDVASLRAMFADHDATASRTVVTYCRTGMQASFAYFVARYLGLDTRIYDGSFVDWSPRTDYPVERTSN